MQRQRGGKREKKERYCICRKTDSTGFMIQCERCEMWFHGACINISKKQAELIDNYFCPNCTKQSNGQCFNPDCINEARGEIEVEIDVNNKIVKKTVKSKYCSDDCGVRYNKLRYEKLFIPKWNQLKNNPSAARTNKLSEMRRIVDETKEVELNIGRLKKEREDLETIITSIKTEATRMKANNQPVREKSIDKDSEEDEDDSGEKQERANEQLKTFCITCGTEQAADKAFKHWYQCHKKQESQIQFTSDRSMNETLQSAYDNGPRLYCEVDCEKGKKKTRYCMHIAAACPLHSNWQAIKDEVCGSPLDVMQELKLDGNYCLELKSECNQHYNWDKFRLAMKDMERVQEFNRLGDLNARLNQATIGLRDTYGGVIGIMLHSTKDYDVKFQQQTDNDDDAGMVDVG